MFCPKCGAQVVEDGQFCPKCGAIIAQSNTAGQIAENSTPPTVQPVQSVYQQPMYGGQPYPNQQYPNQQYGGYPAMGYAVRKRRTVPIVIGVVSAVVVAFIVILFTVILPNGSLEGKLKHEWYDSEDSCVFDFKNNEIKFLNSATTNVDFDWELDDDVLEMEALSYQLGKYTISFSEDGKRLILTDYLNPNVTMTWTRYDKKD